MFHPILANVVESAVAGDLTLQSIIIVLLGILGWVVKEGISGLKDEVRKLRKTIEDNSKVTIVALMAVEQLMPAAKSALERVSREMPAEEHRNEE